MLKYKNKLKRIKWDKVKRDFHGIVYNNTKPKI
jgi:hypothetical protein